MTSIENLIFNLISGSKLMTPVTIEKQISAAHSIPKKDIRSAIKALVSEGRLAYSNDQGGTFLIQSAAMPERISDHVILKAPRLTVAAHKDDVIIAIESGASFGDGRHPTTRLSIRGLDYLLFQTQFHEQHPNSLVLDIGTGSGILAIAALKMGVSNAIGLDIDPCARYEAQINAQHNQVDHRFTINAGDMKDLQDSFDLVIANLRYPTLLAIGDDIAQIIQPNGAAVISGVKSEESRGLIHSWQHQFVCIWEKHEKQWAGFVFFRQQS